jgi:hypothetical protein
MTERAASGKTAIILTDRPARLNVGNVVQKMRRIRTELGQMLQQLDDALERIETGDPD